MKDIQAHLLRRLPFIKVIDHVLPESDTHARSTSYFLQIQLYTPNQHVSDCDLMC